jgi:tRNA dimethylallyltransferase
VPKEELDRRIAERTRRMFDAGVEEEVRGARGGETSTTASKVIGLDEVATLPRAEAIEALTVRTRRYAAYQRKWLRRLEGLVIVAADRPPEETAAEIVALARTRERLPRP